MKPGRSATATERADFYYYVYQSHCVLVLLWSGRPGDFCDRVSPNLYLKALNGSIHFSPLGRRGDKGDDSVEIVFQSFLLEATVRNPGMGGDVLSWTPSNLPALSNPLFTPKVINRGLMGGPGKQRYLCKTGLDTKGLELEGPTPSRSLRSSHFCPTACRRRKVRAFI